MKIKATDIFSHYGHYDPKIEKNVLAVAFFLKNGTENKTIDGITYLNSGLHCVKNEITGGEREFSNCDLLAACVYMAKEINQALRRGYKIS